MDVKLMMMMMTYFFSFPQNFNPRRKVVQLESMSGYNCILFSLWELLKSELTYLLFLGDDRALKNLGAMVG